MSLLQLDEVCKTETGSNDEVQFYKFSITPSYPFIPRFLSTRTLRVFGPNGLFELCC